MRNRFYNTTPGNFISRDVQRAENRYQYADSTPLILIDPLGLAPKPPPPPPVPSPAPYNKMKIAIHYDTDTRLAVLWDAVAQALQQQLGIPVSLHPGNVTNPGRYVQQCVYHANVFGDFNPIIGGPEKLNPNILGGTLGSNSYVYMNAINIRIYNRKWPSWGSENKFTILSNVVLHELGHNLSDGQGDTHDGSVMDYATLPLYGQRFLPYSDQYINFIREYLDWPDKQ